MIQYILDAADEAGIDLPYSCRAGACSSCAAKLSLVLLIKVINLSWMMIKLKQDLSLTCVAYPTSDCVIVTEVEEELCIDVKITY